MTIQTDSLHPSREYILLVALLISIGAMGTDLMLPALGAMSTDLGAPSANDGHLIVTAFFLGMGVGQLFVGPLSDSYGRKPVVYAGYGVFIAGCLISMTTDNWAAMLAARALQGFGAAAPRVVTVAIVRDSYAGNAMARVMSTVMAAFILVPILAPAIGQGLIALGGWRLTFSALAILGLGASLWFAARLPETLPPAQRHPFRIGPLLAATHEVLTSRIAMGYTVAFGLISGVFLAYLGSSQQIFQQVFDTGNLFAAYFALSAASIGAAALLNARLVMRLGMHRLTVTAFAALTLLSAAFTAYLWASGGQTAFALFLAWQLTSFLCVGITFGNLTALAMEPLGHIAGLASALIGAISTFISLPIATAISARFDGTAFPLVAGFAAASLIATGITQLTTRGPRSGRNTAP